MVVLRRVEKRYERRYRGGGRWRELGSSGRVGRVGGGSGTGEKLGGPDGEGEGCDGRVEGA